MSGPLVWEAGGERREALLQVTELERGGRLAPAAAWTPHAGLAWRPRPPAPPPPADLMTNRTFIVLIAMVRSRVPAGAAPRRLPRVHRATLVFQNDPYVMKKQSAVRLFGNDQYEGASRENRGRPPVSYIV